MEDRVLIAYYALRRAFVFLDEWLTYVILYRLYYIEGERSLLILAPIVLMALAFNGLGYQGLWEVEEMLHLHLKRQRLAEQKQQTAIEKKEQ